MFKTIPFAKGANLHIRQTTQFKTVNFSIKWRRALTAKSASERTVLTNVLQWKGRDCATIIGWSIDTENKQCAN